MGIPSEDNKIKGGFVEHGGGEKGLPEAFGGGILLQKGRR